MKMAYKFVCALLSAGLLVAGFSPVAQAANPQCKGLDTRLQTINSGLVSKEKPLAELRVKNTYGSSQGPVVLSTKVASAQKTADKALKETFKRLHAKAKSAAQKTAMTAYETEFTAALKTFRNEQAAASKTYQAANNALVSAHRAAVDGQLVILKNRFQSAHTSAYALCQKSGLAKATALFKSEIQLAQASFAGVPNVSPASVQASLQAAADSYKLGREAAAKKFDETLLASEAKLKTAFTNTKYIFE